ncbi:MAG TPA: hypothetical protein VJL27_03555 [Patescibacteria group bacterium]|nr:hypothetical protein [Patescibacteria group bacterium]
MKGFWLVLAFWLIGTGSAYAQTGLEDLSGLPTGDGLAVTDTTVTSEPVAAETVPATTEPETGPADVALVVGGVAVLGFLLIKSNSSRAKYRI